MRPADGRRGKISLKNISIAIGAVVGVLTVASASTRFVSAAVGAVDHHYVVRDTFLAFQQGVMAAQRDAQMANAARDSLMHRVDARVAAIYCNSLPPEKRAGCQ